MCRSASKRRTSDARCTVDSAGNSLGVSISASRFGFVLARLLAPIEREVGGARREQHWPNDTIRRDAIRGNASPNGESPNCAATNCAVTNWDHPSRLHHACLRWLHDQHRPRLCERFLQRLNDRHRPRLPRLRRRMLWLQGHAARLCDAVYGWMGCLRH